MVKASGTAQTWVHDPGLGESLENSQPTPVVLALRNSTDGLVELAKSNMTEQLQSVLKNVRKITLL